MSRQLSQPVMNNLLAMLEHYESLHDGKLIPNRLTPQMDALGIWTEGYGQLVLDANGKQLKGYEDRSSALSNSKISTKEEALTALGIRLGQTVNALLDSTTGKLTDVQLAAVADLAYNIGIGGFETSTIYRLIQSNQIENITRANFLSWNKGMLNGSLVSLDGLTARRASEWNMFFEGKLQLYSCDKGILTPIEIQA